MAKDAEFCRKFLLLDLLTASIGPPGIENVN